MSAVLCCDPRSICNTFESCISNRNGIAVWYVVVVDVAVVVAAVVVDLRTM
jgi:hypothetical protein